MGLQCMFRLSFYSKLDKHPLYDNQNGRDSHTSEYSFESLCKCPCGLISEKWGGSLLHIILLNNLLKPHYPCYCVVLKANIKSE